MKENNKMNDIDLWNGMTFKESITKYKEKK